MGGPRTYLLLSTAVPVDRWVEDAKGARVYTVADAVFTV